MAVLSDPNRAQVTAQYQTDCGVKRVAIPLTKTELRAAVDAADVWADANAASFNSALPLPARSVMSQQEKANLLKYIMNKRYEVA